MDKKHDPACLPQEILDITWSNTSEERLNEAYKVWADTYDKVRIYSVSVIVYSSCMPMSSRQKRTGNKPNSVMASRKSELLSVKLGDNRIWGHKFASH